jgi:hypothetical protein
MKTPPLFDGLVSPLERCFQSGAPLPTIDPIFGSGFATSSPSPEYPTSEHPSFLNGSAETANSFDPARKLSGSVTGLPQRA